MSQYIGKRVRMVGKVEGVQGNSLQLRAADDGMVTVFLRGAAPSDSYIEVEGNVESPNTIRETACTPFGNNFDLSNYNELCKLSNGQYKSLFM
ncbi:hypothetical protein H632_c1625p0 [Helicosporidium sp. ATCC 50920]|nr:hypothetical protein H632_c1625p0 [Helicosporidium sp. ATCC 50920]|eukprot:KDD74044.1 hypothetical protein H632_c1625p0 [Helicosporidium sp. ATCC 50920]